MKKQNLWGKMENKMKPKKTTDDKIILAQMIFTAIIIALLFGLEHTLENLYIIIAVMVIGFFVQIVIHESPSIFKKKNNGNKNNNNRRNQIENQKISQKHPYNLKTTFPYLFYE